MQASHSLDIRQSMSPTAVKLLQAAAFLGGEKQLAVPPGAGQPLLGKLVAASITQPTPCSSRPWTSCSPIASR